MKAPKWVIALTASAALALAVCQGIKNDISAGFYQNQESIESRVQLGGKVSSFEKELTSIQSKIAGVEGKSPAARAAVFKWMKNRLHDLSAQVEVERIDLYQKKMPVSKQLAELQTAINGYLEQVKNSENQ